MHDRITNPQTIPSERELLDRPGNRLPVIQFSQPSYGEGQLEQVNTLCRSLGNKVEVRFYGHHSEPFDASVLRHLPDVRRLSIDCLHAITNLDALYELQALQSFSFGVETFDDAAFLKNLRLGKLEDFALTNTKKNNIELGRLAEAPNLKSVWLYGHTKQIERLADCPKLNDIILGQIQSSQSLEFLSDVENLESLRIILGGRPDTNEVQHTNLQKLEIIRVRGYGDTGDLARFPRLSTLVIEDQIQLETLSLRGASLRALSIYNCKKLTSIDGLESQKGLASVKLVKTALPLDELARRKWPESLEVLALRSGSKRSDDALRTLLNERGYSG